MPKVVIKETVTIKREACESGDGISEELKADWDEAKRRRFAEYNLNLDNTLATRIPEFEMSEGIKVIISPFLHLIKICLHTKL